MIPAEKTPVCANPVSGNGRMGTDGYEPENAAWIEALTETRNGKRVGRDPMALSVPVLTASGHGPRRSRSVVAAMGDVALTEGATRYTTFRKHCLDCAENAAEVRRCAVIDCPFWAYRMGKNPHNPRRGRNPFQ